jgi:hypothetical protein
MITVYYRTIDGEFESFVGIVQAAELTKLLDAAEIQGPSSYFPHAIYVDGALHEVEHTSLEFITDDELLNSTEFTFWLVPVSEEAIDTYPN